MAMEYMGTQIVQCEASDKFLHNTVIRLLQSKEQADSFRQDANVPVFPQRDTAAAEAQMIAPGFMHVPEHVRLSEVAQSTCKLQSIKEASYTADYVSVLAFEADGFRPKEFPITVQRFESNEEAEEAIMKVDLLIMDILQTTDSKPVPASEAPKRAETRPSLSKRPSLDDAFPARTWLLRGAGVGAGVLTVAGLLRLRARVKRQRQRR